VAVEAIHGHGERHKFLSRRAVTIRRRTAPQSTVLQVHHVRERELSDEYAARNAKCRTSDAAHRGSVTLRTATPRRVRTAENGRRPAVCSDRNGGLDERSPVLIPPSRCREFLGSEAAGLSDAEIDLVRRHADALARVIVDTFIENHPGGG
jgi:hypothetical protein